MGGLHSSRKAKSAHWPPSATERRKCKSRVMLLLRDADSGQIDHMAAEPTHGPHHPCTSSSRLGARGTLLAIANVSLNGGSTPYDRHRYVLVYSVFQNTNSCDCTHPPAPVSCVCRQHRLHCIATRDHRKTRALAWGAHSPLLHSCEALTSRTARVPAFVRARH